MYSYCKLKILNVSKKILHNCLSKYASKTVVKRINERERERGAVCQEVIAINVLNHIKSYLQY